MTSIAFDFGHTLMDEVRDADIELDRRPIHLMPGVAEVIPRLRVPLALWANTRVAGEAMVRDWLRRAALDQYFRWVTTSVDAGVRKPDRRFFEYALSRSALGRDEVLFVGNQLNTDIAGAAAYGIRTVWLSGAAYRSDDDRPSDARPTYTIETLYELPGLVERLRRT